MANENDMEVICRACLNETNSFKCIYKVGMLCGEITTLSAMLAECTSIEFNEEEDLPRFICMKCVSHLSRSYLFRQTVLKSNETLREQHSSIKTEEEMIDTLFYYEQSVQSEIMEDEEEENEDEDEEEEEGEEEEEEEENQAETNEDTGDIVMENDGIKIELTSAEIDSGTQYEVTLLKDDDQMMIERNEVVIDETSQTSSMKGAEMPQEVKKIVTQKRRSHRKKTIPGPPFKCEVCGKILSNHSSYKYHMQLHSDATPFLCSHCGEKFKTRNSYDGHMTTHDSLNPNCCNICGKTYRQPSSLRIHILTHTGEKPYLCGICGKGLTQKSGFKKHMLVHTGEKPFKCELCNKEFRYSSNLITHKRGHTGEKPFECKDCDKKFTSGEQLKRHHLIHSGERPFSCETCGKTFNRRSTLMVHKQIHNGKTATATKSKE